MTANLKYTRRLAALAILLAAMAIPYFLGVAPIIAAHETLDRDIAEKRLRLAALNKIAAQKKLLEEQFMALEHGTSKSGLYLIGDTGPLAAARLQQLVKSQIQMRKGQVQSIKTLPVKTVHGCNRVTVTVELQATLMTVQKVLHALEGNSPLLFVSNMQIIHRGAARKSQQLSEPLLTVRFDVAGFLQPKVT